MVAKKASVCMQRDEFREGQPNFCFVRWHLFTSQLNYLTSEFF